jgi:hypothetical protein
MPGTPAWDVSAPLNVIIASGVGSADGGEQAFFFADGKYIGTDTAETSTGITASRRSDLIVIHYALYNTSDPRCFPTGGTDPVRFYWTGTDVVDRNAGEPPWSRPANTVSGGSPRATSMARRRSVAWVSASSRSCCSPRTPSG